MIKRTYFVAGFVRSGLEFGAAHTEFWRLFDITTFLPVSPQEIIKRVNESAKADSPYGHFNLVTITAFNRVK